MRLLLSYGENIICHANWGGKEGTATSKGSRWGFFYSYFYSVKYCPDYLIKNVVWMCPWGAKNKVWCVKAVCCIFSQDWKKLTFLAESLSCLKEGTFWVRWCGTAKRSFNFPVSALWATEAWSRKDGSRNMVRCSLYSLHVPAGGGTYFKSIAVSLSSDVL